MRGRLHIEASVPLIATPIYMTLLIAPTDPASQRGDDVTRLSKRLQSENTLSLSQAVVTFCM